MAFHVLRFVNLLLASLVTGTMVGTLALIHPALRTLPLPAHVQAEREITRRYRAAMPALMAATVASCFAVLAARRDRGSAAFRLILAGMLATTAVEVPINKRTQEADPAAPPADWTELRERWDRFHLIRSVSVLAGWSFLVLGVLADAPD